MKLHLLRLFLIMAVSVLLLNNVAQSQISQGGRPLSFAVIDQLTSQYDSREFSRPDMEMIASEDRQNAESQFPAPERMGVSVPVNLDMTNSGTWESLPDGSRMWRLKIIVKDALALGVYYDHFSLPEGGSLFLYNKAQGPSSLANLGLGDVIY